MAIFNSFLYVYQSVKDPGILGLAHPGPPNPNQRSLGVLVRHDADVHRGSSVENTWETCLAPYFHTYIHT